MSTLNEITITSKQDWGWLGNNVAYLASLSLPHLKLPLGGLRRVDILLGDEDLPWSGDTQFDCTTLTIRFDPALLNPDSPQESQEHILAAMLRGLASLPAPHRLSPEQIEALRQAVRDTGFSVERSTRMVARTPTEFGMLRIEPFFRTAMDHCQLLLRMKVGRAQRDVDLIRLWPAPMLLRLAFRGVAVEDGHLVLTFFHDSASSDRRVLGHARFEFPEQLRPAKTVRQSRQLRIHFHFAIDALVRA